MILGYVKVPNSRFVLARGACKYCDFYVTWGLTSDVEDILWVHVRVSHRSLSDRCQNVNVLQSKRIYFIEDAPKQLSGAALTAHMKRLAKELENDGNRR